MTLHSAKGLEVNRVIVAGLADQILPGEVDSQDQREERRRLLYVAVTRAREQLVVS
jgi:DNA helicase-2/ATP-dependent DNA helicase PcrA